MQLQAAQVLEPVVPAVRSRDGGDTRTRDGAFWELLAEHGPDRAGSKARSAEQPDQQPEDPAELESEADAEQSRASLNPEDGESQGESGGSGEQTAHSIAAAILADLQPLTIGILNRQLLRADPRVQQETAANATGGAGASSAPIAGMQQGSGPSSRQDRAGVEPEHADPQNPQPRELRRAEVSDASSRQSDIALDRIREAGGRLDDQSAERPQDTHTVATNSASQHRATQPVAAVAAASTAAPPALKAVDASQASRPAQVASPAAAVIAGSAGRKAGGDAHMPRWDAQRPSPAGTRTATSERHAAMVASQVARGMAVALSRADGALTLRLNPESLGFVRIRMEVENGTLHAKFETSTDQARQLLEQSSETLRASLEAKGWESSRFRVEVLREADPAAEMLRRLEQQAEGRLGRFTAEDSAAGSESGAGSSGGDREHNQSNPSPSSHGRELELCAEPAQREGGSAVSGIMMVSSSRVDTIA